MTQTEPKPIVLKRVKQPLATLPTPDVHVLGASVKHALASAFAAHQVAVWHLILAGQEMRIAKELLGETRGKVAEGAEPPLTWKVWTETYVPHHSERWCSELVRASAKYKESETNAEILALLNVAPSQLSDEQRTKLEDATRRFADNRSLREIIVGGAPAKPRSGGGGSGEPMPEQKPIWYDDAMWKAYQAAENGSDVKNACIALGPLIRDLLPLASEEPGVACEFLAHLPKAFLLPLHSHLAQAAKRLAKMLPTAKVKKPAKAKAKKGAK